jgi:hypothetical protein
MRRILTRLPTCRSTGLGVFFTTGDPGSDCKMDLTDSSAKAISSTTLTLNQFESGHAEILLTSSKFIRVNAFSFRQNSRNKSVNKSTLTSEHHILHPI